jgi:hypothetical protein
MKEIKLLLPATSKREVWIGSYGGHYNCVVIFHTKPAKKVNGRNRASWQSYSYVDLLENKKCIAACMWECDFMDIYPTANIPAPKEIEVTTLYKRTLWGFWTDDNRIEFPVFNADGY